MASLKELHDRFKSLQGQELKIAANAFNEHADVAANMVAEQLAKGIQSDGNPTDYFYSTYTIAIKKTRTGLAAVTDHVTNYDTGESYRGLYFRVNGLNVEGGTTTDKEDAISERMNGRAFLPMPDNKHELIKNFVNPTYNKMIRELVKL